MNVYNYNHFFYFYITAKLGGVTMAAKYLKTSQSSLSSQIKTLEGVIGKKVFRKSGRRMELTDSGREIFNYCRRAFEVFDEMFDQLNKTVTSMGVRISIGVSTDIERPFVTDALSRVLKKFSKDQCPLVNLISLPSSQLLQHLKVGEIDFLLATETVIDTDMEIISEFDFPLGVFSSQRNDTLTKKVTLEEFVKKEQITFVLPSKLTSLRSDIDSYFLKKKINPICVFESNIISSVIRATADGLGVSILPSVYTLREVKSGGLVELNVKSPGKHRIMLLSQKKRLEKKRKDFALDLADELSFT